jgi:hypothetical protein
MLQHCPNCSAALVGEFCHACGQQRIGERLTVRLFLTDVARRVFRFDRAFVRTFWGMLRAPGPLVSGYIEGRRRTLLDPLHYFISSVFVQFVLAALMRLVSPMVYRASELGWLERLGSIVGLKILIMFWLVSIWYLLFRQIRYNLAEIYVFGTYVFGTTGLLWACVPIVDLLVPLPLGANGLVVSSITLAIELVYTSYAVHQFSRLPLWQSILRVSAVLAVGYGVLVALLGLDRTIVFLLPPMPAPG